ncbi:hypothetical protein K505DRAFT_380389 [Melanomma pulvis-pyrius CBS 109.77]|uniref:FAD/NAD(P)-binding domain-containing protein n=1 Tax=Melanomma pulvis-pyrius CBS 109.77 TaxID=1314802 RepID=A0A6A6WQ72_9PLEO|nr:hypothetical protein K505DRAFT_380389 [Melanomma pulvis-pyrius CBS 109.77]
MQRYPATGVLVEAEAFDDYGGWVMDSQFDLEMGSPYLLAHGNGVPVADATTQIAISAAGEYHVWLRAKDWVPGHHPGRFTLSINDEILLTVFGANDCDWGWQYGGKKRLEAGPTNLSLHDLTGFGGRCDAIFLTQEEGKAPPNGADDVARAWRRGLRGLPAEPVVAGSFDLVVAGGGVPGCVAALAAARLGIRVALIQDRPYLGGNASVEIGLRPRGTVSPLTDEVYQRHANGDLRVKELLDAESSASVFLNHTVYSVGVADSSITFVDARDARSGRESRFVAPIFVDCSGKAILGLLAGAETLFGQESQTEYGESLAPRLRTNRHHGNTVFFRTRTINTPTPFPNVPWATVIAKDYADLSGQLEKFGTENLAGPKVSNSKPGVPGQEVKRRMTLPMTHYWEYGQNLDPYTQGEHIRDHLLRAIYGTFSNVKSSAPATYANLVLDHVAYVAAQGQFRRYRGAHVLSETDIRTHRQFPDAVVKNRGAFCLHYGGHEKYDFRLADWEWDERDGKDYDVPFRCLYSVNIRNLMMAGKHISATHIAGSNVKFMGNGAEHAIATAVAAHLCRKYGCVARDLVRHHMIELQRLAGAISSTGQCQVSSRI